MARCCWSPSSPNAPSPGICWPTYEGATGGMLERLPRPAGTGPPRGGKPPAWPIRLGEMGPEMEACEAWRWPGSGGEVMRELGGRGDGPGKLIWERPVASSAGATRSARQYCTRPCSSRTRRRPPRRHNTSMMIVDAAPSRPGVKPHSPMNVFLPAAGSLVHGILKSAGVQSGK